MKKDICLAKGKNEVPYLRSRILDSFKDISHGFSTRNGGVSPEPFGTLNVGVAVGDKPENVRENRNLLSEITGAKRAVYLSQVHGSEILLIKGPEDVPDPDSVKADAVITDQKDLMLVIQTADCQAVLLFDPVKKIAAAIHSGWRGNVLDIIGETVKKMAIEFCSDPSDIRAVIGPSLGPCCAEFINYRNELPEKIWSFGDNEKKFDFWGVSICQLEEAGLVRDNIDLLGHCSKCDGDNFFSYRLSKVTGRMAGFIYIKE